MTEDQAIEQLTSYRAKKARIQALGTYKVGVGITISRLSEDDELQQLHRRLRGRPSYLYLSKREQELESTAHAYLQHYPAGTRAQRAAIPDVGYYEEDDALLRELRIKIGKIIDARTGYKKDLDDVLERLAELQDLRAEVGRIEQILNLLEEYKPEYVRLLQLAFIDGRPWTEVAGVMCLSKDGFYRLRRKSLREFTKIAF